MLSELEIKNALRRYIVSPSGGEPYFDTNKAIVALFGGESPEDFNAEKLIGAINSAYNGEDMLDNLVNAAIALMALGAGAVSPDSSLAALTDRYKYDLFTDIDSLDTSYDGQNSIIYVSRDAITWATASLPAGWKASGGDGLIFSTKRTNATGTNVLQSQIAFVFSGRLDVYLRERQASSETWGEWQTVSSVNLLSKADRRSEDIYAVKLFAATTTAVSGEKHYKIVSEPVEKTAATVNWEKAYVKIPKAGGALTDFERKTPLTYDASDGTLYEVEFVDVSATDEIGEAEDEITAYVITPSNTDLKVRDVISEHGVTPLWLYYDAAFYKFSYAESDGSVASGKNTLATGAHSFAAGEGCVAVGNNQTVIGRYNVPVTGGAFVVGNGTDDEHRENAAVITSDGEMLVNVIGGDGNPFKNNLWKLATEEFVKRYVNGILCERIGEINGEELTWINGFIGSDGSTVTDYESGIMTQDFLPRENTALILYDGFATSTKGKTYGCYVCEYCEPNTDDGSFIRRDLVSYGEGMQQLIKLDDECRYVRLFMQFHEGVMTPMSGYRWGCVLYRDKTEDFELFENAMSGATVPVDLDLCKTIDYTMYELDTTWGNVGKSKIVPILGASEASLTAGDSGTRYLFVTDIHIDLIKSGEEKKALAVPPHTNRGLPANETKTLHVPPEAKYLIVWAENSVGESRLPATVLLHMVKGGDIGELNRDTSRLQSGGYTVDLDQAAVVPFALATYGTKWGHAIVTPPAVDQSNYYVVHLNGGKHVNIKTGQHGSRYLFLTDAEGIEDMADAHVPDGAVTQPISAYSDEVINVPDNANHVAIWRTASSGIDMSPQSVRILYGDRRKKKVFSGPIFNLNLGLNDSYADLVRHSDDGHTKTDAGLVMETGFADKYVTINKYIVCNDVSYRANVRVGIVSGAPVGSCTLGTVEMNRELTGVDRSDRAHATIVEFDFTNAKVRFKQDAPGIILYDGTTFPEYNYAPDGLPDAMVNLSGDHYRIEIGRKRRCPYAAVYNLTTGATCYYAELTAYATAESYIGKAGALYDLPTFAALSGSITFERVAAFVPTDVDVCFLGDSNTEGHSLAYDDVWANRITEHVFNGNGLNMGHGGGTIIHMLKCAEDILPVVKPKIVVVMIGSNGTPATGETEGVTTRENYNLLYAAIKSVGAIPVFVVFPRGSGTASGSLLPAERFAARTRYILSLDGDHPRFDIATSNNYSLEEGQNVNLFVSDKQHLSAAGATEVYKQFMATVGWQLS